MHNFYIILNQLVTTASKGVSTSSTVYSWQSTFAVIQSQVVQFLHAAGQMLPAILLGILAVTCCYFIARPLSYVLLKPLGYVSESRLLHLVVRRFISTLIILFGLYIFLRLAGLTEFAVAVMSGTGLLGLILGFAFKDIAENFISSLLLSVQRPFRIDDVIEVNGHLGVVKKVTARATTLVDFDGNHIQIPNATVYKNTIKNLTANPKMRGSFTLGIGYDNNIKQAQQLALTVISNQKAVLNDPVPQVLINDLGSATLNFTIYFWVNSEEHSVLKVASQLMRELVNEFTDHGISMPDDARERILLNSQGEDLYPAKRESQQTEKVPTPPKKPHTSQVTASSVDDISSDTDEIREQAEKSRDPEQGSNII